jgi:hypothetical protein
MKIGPFSINDVNGIEELLESKNLEYTASVDHEAERAILNRFNDTATLSPRQTAGTLDLKIVYFEIADADYEKVKDSLEKYGVVPVSDGSFELGEEE